MIKFESRDITSVERGIIVQGCNAQGVMGSGVAKAIRAKWPGVFADYKKLCDSVDTPADLLGEVSLYSVPDLNLYVINGITQERYGTDKKVYASVPAIRSVLIWAVVESAGLFPDQAIDIYLPRIGCGLGGLQWDLDVYPMLQEVDAYMQHWVNGQDLTFIVCDI